MKRLVDFINERGPAPYYGNDTMLRDVTEIVADRCGDDAWDRCDMIRCDDMLQQIVDILENYEEKTSTRLTELDALNNMRKEEVILCASYNNQADDIAETLESFVDEEALFAENNACIFNGENVDVYYEEFKDLKICGVSEWQNGREYLWTFFIASDKI